MANKDEIKELFSKSFEGFEKEVDPGLWDKIQSNLNQPGVGNSTQVGSAAKTGLIKSVVIGTVSVGAIIGGVLFFNNNNETPTNENIETPVVSNQENKDKLNDLVVVENNTETVDMIESSDDPVIVEHKEEIKKEILEDFNHEVIDNGDINDLLDQDLLNQLANADKNKSDKKNHVVVEENNNDDHKDVKVDNQDDKIDHNTGVDHKVEHQKSEEELYLEKLANVLTPNGDNINDYLTFNHKGISKFNLIVASETGKLIYEKSASTIKWNGTDNAGNILKEGKYKMIIVAFAKDGSKYVRKSYFHIRK